MRIFENINVDFMGKRKLFYIVSAVIIIAGIASVAVRGIALGLDFKGGTEIVARFPQEMEIGELRIMMNKANLGSFEIKSFGTDTDYIIRTERKGEGAKISDQVKDYLNASVDGEIEVLQENRVEAKIGSEIRRDAIIAIFFALVGILAYISFRFKFIFATGAVAALFHDTLVVFGLVSILNGVIPGLNLEFDQAMVAAFLTIVGYSINDTVIVFDRIREMLKVQKSGSFEATLNKAINTTMSRTIITSVTTFIAMSTLMLFGGEPTRGFAFAMVLGVLTGTYSSIFVASALTLDWVKSRNAKITF
jgi:preprotein translocase subunit SecF